MASVTNVTPSVGTQIKSLLTGTGQPTVGATPRHPASTGLPVGSLVLLGFGAIALADTQIAPLVVGFLLTAVIYNASKILNRK